MSKPFRLTDRVRSIRFALNGLTVMIRTQHNAWIHVFASLAVVAAGILLRAGTIDWCILTLAIVSVWTAEALNTAFEFLADVASPDFHPLVEKAKDVASAGVLIAAIGSVAIGILILGPLLQASLAN